MSETGRTDADADEFLAQATVASYGTLADHDEVFIGTGAKVKRAAADFLIPDSQHAVLATLPDEEKLRLIAAQDIRTGQVVYADRVLLNLFGDNLSSELQDYLEKAIPIVRERLTVGTEKKYQHVKTLDVFQAMYTLEGTGAKRAGSRKQFYAEHANKPKLLIPQIGGPPQILLDEEGFYPYGNMLFIVSGSWDLRLLQAFLRSSLAELALKVAKELDKGSNRDRARPFHPYHARSIPLPTAAAVLSNASSCKALIQATASGDHKQCDNAVAPYYGLDATAMAAIREMLGRGTLHDQSPGTQTDDEAIEAAVINFWEKRPQVREDAHMTAFTDLLTHVACRAGLEPSDVHTVDVALPSYFRATKEWDVVIVRDGILLAALEVKSQLKDQSDFGQNVNNRFEEAIGSGHDLKEAHLADAFIRNEHFGITPFRGYIMILEDCPAATAPVVDLSEPHFLVFGEFFNKSVEQRYDLALRRFVERELYNSAALLLTKRPGRPGHFRSASKATSIKGFLSDLEAALTAAVRRMSTDET